MVAPLPQERTFKDQFDRTHFAAKLGGNFMIPSYEGGNADALDEDQNERRVFSKDSEDGIMAQYPLNSPLSPEATDLSMTDPNNFSYYQQQARMQQGIGAPSYLPDDAADLLDPSVSTDDTPVTYGEAIDQLEEKARNAQDFEGAQAAGNAVRQKTHEAIDQAAEVLQKKLQEKIRGKLVQWGINGTNAAGSFGWDGFISFSITLLCLIARGIVTILVPESTNADQESTTTYATKKAIHTLFPPYHFLSKDADFLNVADTLYALLPFFIGAFIISLLFAIFIAIASFIMFPILLPGAATS